MWEQCTKNSILIAETSNLKVNEPNFQTLLFITTATFEKNISA